MMPELPPVPSGGMGNLSDTPAADQTPSTQEASTTAQPVATGQGPGVCWASQALPMRGRGFGQSGRHSTSLARAHAPRSQMSV